MRIAILGTRGIPNHYGGFEQYAELLSAYLVAQGWDVLVYNSSTHPYREQQYNGVTIKHIYDPESKWGTIGQFVYDLMCILNTRKQKFDVVYQLGYTSSAIFNFLFPGKTTIVTNMDGLEWKRTKYNKWVQYFLRFSERLAVKMSDYLVADSVGIKNYLDEKYKVDAFFSAYTASIPGHFDESVLKEYDLAPFSYDLVIARMEPENNIEMIIKGYLAADPVQKLIIIGNVDIGYGKHLAHKYQSDKVIFKGAVYEKNKLDTLRHFAGLYFHGHSVGGTNPSLLEAMACDCRILAHENQFNRGVLENNALYFSSSEVLKRKITDARKDADLFKDAIANNRKRINEFYSETAVFFHLKNKLLAWSAQNQTT